jgi:hypothetical protein
VWLDQGKLVRDTLGHVYLKVSLFGKSKYLGLATMGWVERTGHTHYDVETWIKGKGKYNIKVSSFDWAVDSSVAYLNFIVYALNISKSPGPMGGTSNADIADSWMVEQGYEGYISKPLMRKFVKDEVLEVAEPLSVVFMFGRSVRDHFLARSSTANGAMMGAGQYTGLDRTAGTVLARTALTRTALTHTALTHREAGYIP